MTDQKTTDGVEAVYEALKTLTKSHSFQLVSLQNEIERLKSEREKTTEQMSDMKDKMKELYSEMANLKGFVARLRIDGFMQGTAIKSEDDDLEETSETDDYNRFGILDAVRRHRDGIDTLVDEILRQEKRRLCSTLTTIQMIANNIDSNASRLRHGSSESLKDEENDSKVNVKVEQ